MTQILRLENPLFGRGLKLPQRLCYLNSAAHFLFALPRLVFLMAPLIYLIYGGTNLPGTWRVILAFAVPHLVMLYLTHLRIQGRHRHSFWNEIYETVLAPYVLLPTIGAFLWPKRPKFNVTAKGQVLQASFFDRRIARPFLLMLFVNFVGLLCAVPRLHLFPASTAPRWQGWLLSVPHRMYDPHHLGTIVVNVVWTLFNMMLLSVATAVAWENQQRRRAVRVNVEVPAGVILPDGNVVQGLTGDLSCTGVRLWTGSRLNVRPGDAVRMVLPVLDGDASLAATVVRVEDESLRAQFDELSLADEEALTMVLYSRADAWLGWDESRERDHPVRSFARVLRLALRGLRQTILPGRRSRDAGLVTSIVPLLIAAVLLPAWGRAVAQDQKPAEAAVQSTTTAKPAEAKPPELKQATPDKNVETKQSDVPVKPAPPAKQAETPAKPADAAAKSTDPSVKPTNAAAKQAETPAKPTDVASKSTDAAVKPTNAAAKQAETPAKPTDSTAKQTTSTASAEHPAASGQVKSQGADGVAAGGAAKTAQTPATQTEKKESAEKSVAPSSGTAQGSGKPAAKDAGEVPASASTNVKAVHAENPAAPVVTAGDAAVTTPVSPAPPVSQPVARDPVKPQSASAAASGNFKAQAAEFYRGRVLPVWGRASVLAAQYPWGLLILVVLQTFLIAVLLRASLRRRARERLLGHI